MEWESNGEVLIDSHGNVLGEMDCDEFVPSRFLLEQPVERQAEVDRFVRGEEDHEQT